MKILTLALIICGSAFGAKLKMSPGLWEINMSMKDALAKVPPEKRKEIEAMRVKLGAGGGPNKGFKICYTEKMINDPKAVMDHQNRQCKNTLVTQTESQIKSTFKCKDGTTGDALWKIEEKNFNWVVNMNSPKRGKSSMTYIAKFIASDCGNVKPIEAAK